MCFNLEWHEALLKVFEEGGYIQGESYKQNQYATVSPEGLLVYYEICIFNRHKFAGRPFITTDLIQQKYRWFEDSLMVKLKD